MTFKITYDNNHLNFKDCVVHINARDEDSARRKFALYIHNEIDRHYCPLDITVKMIEKIPVKPESL